MRTSTAILCSVSLALAACGDEENPIDLDVTIDVTDTGDSGDASADVADVAAPDTDTSDEEVEPAECGNGVTEGDEECDDGNTNDDDSCRNDCTGNGGPVCSECTADFECGGATDRCIEIAGVMRCGIDCSSTECPRGYECGVVVRDGRVLENQCRPVSGDCSVCEDGDEDGVCDWDDVCEGFDDGEDRDEDGIPDGCDECPDDATGDSDSDGVCDSEDVCPGGIDTADVDEDGIPNACDPCPFANPNDEDGDEVCDDVDRCLGHDDRVDVDMDRIPDGCDDSVEICTDGIDNDGDEVIDCLDSDCARHTACGPCDSPLEIGLGTVRGATEEGAGMLGTEDCGFGDAEEAAFAFVAETAGTYCANTIGSEFDTILYARTSCGDPSSELDCDDDGADGATSQLEFSAAPGTPVYLIVDGYDELEFGNYALTVSAGTCDAAAAAAICSAAAAVGEGTFTGELPFVSVADSAGCRGTAGGEVVWAYTPTATGPVCMRARGTDTPAADTILYVRRSCTDRTSELGCHDNVDNFSDFSSRLELNVSAGTVYYVFVDEYDDGWGGVGGAVELTITAGSCF